MVRTGVGAIAVAVAALTIGFSLYTQVGHGIAPAKDALRGDGRLVSLATADESGFTLGTHDPSDPPPTTFTRASFGERFSLGQSEAPGRSLPDAQPSASFDDRFTGTISPTLAPARFFLVEPRAPGPRMAPAPRAAARIAVAAPKRTAPKIQLASLGDDPLPTAYAPTDSAPKDLGIRDLLLRDLAPNDPAPKDAAPKDSNPLSDTSRTAIYDIAAHTVYLPDGQRLEAHSGLGSHMDDPRSVKLKSHGPTPPNTYELKLRETTFHGVRAIRLNPVDETRMYGRDGILAHTYMLGPNGQSNGCVSFSDYEAFLNAFLRGEVDRLVVVEQLTTAPTAKTASGWLANTLKDIFRRS